MEIFIGLEIVGKSARKIIFKVFRSHVVDR